MPENCIYKTVELQAGEKFVLPTGAEVLSVSDELLIESSCGGTFNSQDLACFYMQWAVNVDVEGNRQVFLTAALPVAPATGPIKLPKMNNAWDPDDATDGTIKVLNIGGAGIVIPGDFSCQSLTSLESALAANSTLNGLLTNRKFNHIDVFDTMDAASSTNFFGPGNYGNSGYTLYGIWFKAIEEIGKTIYVEIQGGSGNTGTPTRYYAQVMDCGDFPNTSEVASSSGGINTFGGESTSTTTTILTPSFYLTTTTTITSTTTTTTLITP